MTQFLERQYIAMVNKEEVNLMKYNLGKISEHQKTIDGVIKPNYAYVKDPSPDRMKRSPSPLVIAAR